MSCGARAMGIGGGRLTERWRHREGCLFNEALFEVSRRRQQGRAGDRYLVARRRRSVALPRTIMYRLPAADGKVHRPTRVSSRPRRACDVTADLRNVEWTCAAVQFFSPCSLPLKQIDASASHDDDWRQRALVPTASPCLADSIRSMARCRVESIIYISGQNYMPSAGL